MGRAGFRCRGASGRLDHRASWRVSIWYLLRFFAGFCLIANGTYLAVGSLDNVGDAGDLLRHGASIGQLWVFGGLCVPAGFLLWHRLGPHFGLGRSQGCEHSDGIRMLGRADRDCVVNGVVRRGMSNLARSFLSDRYPQHLPFLPPKRSQNLLARQLRAQHCRRRSGGESVGDAGSERPAAG